MKSVTGIVPPQKNLRDESLHQEDAVIPRILEMTTSRQGIICMVGQGEALHLDRGLGDIFGNLKLNGPKFEYFWPISVQFVQSTYS